MTAQVTASTRRGPLEVPQGLAAPRGFDELVAQYEDPRILDFGCGYGSATIGLLLAGFDVWGIDVDGRAIETAQKELARRGLDPERVSTLRPDGRSAFPDGSFDIVFSDQVLEHVADLEVVVAEIARVLRPGGTTLHQWPARWRPVESHLLMPCIHWLPKNNLRRAAIHFWTLLGVRWPWPPELDPGAGRRALAEFGYRYSVERTFYRAAGVVERSFRAHGFGIEPIRHARLDALAPALRPLARHLLRTFRSMTLAARKPAVHH